MEFSLMNLLKVKHNSNTAYQLLKKLKMQTKSEATLGSSKKVS